ncbi:MGMT family protein [Solimonas variicoloris]|uniref:MGMT family protein n=1 Tax=Solimonas variicoloris TaxID=254408 RepID=UPI00037D1809|nr:MGMT family protein [Solimonas variicoloris]
MSKTVPRKAGPRAAGPLRPATAPASRAALAPPPTLAARHAAIWATIRRIPRGKVATYGQVADLAGFARQPRLTAQALRHVPDGMDLPWYRVISASGRSSLPGEAGQREQRRRLEAEGVIFDARGRVDFERCRWRPRGDAPVLD